MTTPLGSQYANITLIDLQLASVYYAILIDLAKHKNCLTYGELVERAKQEYLDRPVVQKAIAVSAGRRLDVVRLFTDERELPDLTSLVIGKASGECGTGFTNHFDPKKTREKVFEFDWSDVTTDFDGFLKSTEQEIKPRKKVKEPEALKVMAEYYKENKATLSSEVRLHKDAIVELIMEGFSAAEAFSSVVRQNAH
ncbi:MAG: hypothetical protein K2W92_02395 [Alphaproteobacteria bacterium]|nr:hypothetical protein [Alphaproteobacteria bacterium]